VSRFDPKTLAREFAQACPGGALWPMPGRYALLAASTWICSIFDSGDPIHFSAIVPARSSPRLTSGTSTRPRATGKSHDREQSRWSGRKGCFCGPSTFQQQERFVETYLETDRGTARLSMGFRRWRSSMTLAVGKLAVRPCEAGSLSGRHSIPPYRTTIRRRRVDVQLRMARPGCEACRCRCEVPLSCWETGEGDKHRGGATRRADYAARDISVESTEPAEFESQHSRRSCAGR